MGVRRRRDRHDHRQLLGEVYSWSLSFSAAGVSMLLSLFVFIA